MDSLKSIKINLPGGGFTRFAASHGRKPVAECEAAEGGRGNWVFPRGGTMKTEGFSSEARGCKPAGFTLVEAVVYVAIVGILITAISSLTLGMVVNYRSAGVKDELALSAQKIFEVFFKETKNAENIDLTASVLDDDAGALALATLFQLGDDFGLLGQTKLYLSEGRVFVKREGETPAVLTSDSLEVFKFRFVRVAPKANREGVRFYLSLKSKDNPQETLSVTTFTMIRGGYTQ